MEPIPQYRRNQALRILRCQLIPNEPFTGDILYEALLHNGFSNDEAGRLVGSLMRTASSNGWIKKSENWIQSRRNRSNIQIIWIAQNDSKVGAKLLTRNG
jgi:hypothetical protein